MGQCGWFPLDHSEILAWVEQHRDELPTTLTELSTYPIAFRRVIVNYVSAEQRTAFWQDHLRSFLAPPSGLTAAQQAFVVETIPVLKDVFASESLEAMRAKFRTLDEQVRVLFTREQGAAMFGMVGPAEPPEGLPIPPGTRVTPVE